MNPKYITMRMMRQNGRNLILRSWSSSGWNDSAHPCSVRPCFMSSKYLMEATFVSVVSLPLLSNNNHQSQVSQQSAACGARATYFRYRRPGHIHVQSSEKSTNNGWFWRSRSILFACAYKTQLWVLVTFNRCLSRFRQRDTSFVLRPLLTSRWHQQLSRQRSRFSSLTPHTWARISG